VLRRRAFARAFFASLPPETIAGRHDLDSLDAWDLQATRSTRSSLQAQDQ
jgi:hypothetical protein